MAGAYILRFRRCCAVINEIWRAGEGVFSGVSELRNVDAKEVKEVDDDDDEEAALNPRSRSGERPTRWSVSEAIALFARI